MFFVKESGCGSGCDDEEEDKEGKDEVVVLVVDV